MEEEIKPDGWVVYACAEGPRFETRAEIGMMKDYADVVGMTLCPEVVMMKEAGICYYGYTVPVNYATGVREDLNWDLKGVLKSSRQRLQDTMDGVVRGYRRIEGESCPICE